MDELLKVEETENDMIRKEVVLAYHDVINQLKTMNSNLPDNDSVSDVDNIDINKDIVVAASRENVEGFAKNIAEFKTSIVKVLDEIKAKLSLEYEKFHTLRQAIAISEEELDYLYNIKANVNTLSALILAQREKKNIFEKEINEKRAAFENEINQLERERIREQNEYIQKRDATRKREQEHYENEKKMLYHELLENRHQLETEFEAREAALAARETEHQQLKEREARIIAREQEYNQLKDKESRFPEELRNAVQKAEVLMRGQLSRKQEYDMKLAKIEWDSERSQYLQKIETLEKQIEQYKNLKDLFSGAMVVG